MGRLQHLIYLFLLFLLCRRRAIAKAEDLISATLNILYTKQVKDATQKYIDDLRVIRQNYKSLV